MVRSVSDGLMGYVDEIRGDRARARASLAKLAARYGYSDCLRIIEAAIAEGATGYDDVFDPSKAKARLKAWRPYMRDEAMALAGWDA